MGRPMDAYDGIAMASLVVYTVFLAGAAALCAMHGLARSSGWRFLAVVAVARVVGAALRLATVSAPGDAGLYAGWMTLNGLGLGPLVLALLALLARVFDSVARQGRVVVATLHRRIVELVMLVAVMLVVAGGIESSYTVGAHGQPRVDYSEASRAGTALIAVVVAALCLEALLAVRYRHLVSRGEHRIVVAVVALLPLIIARLAYSCLGVFGGAASTVWIYLALLVIPEMIVVAVCEALGFSLDRAPPPPKAGQEV